MQSLFVNVPAELFRPLSARGAVVYASALLTIFELTRRYSQPLSRELALQGVMGVLQGGEDPLEELDAFEDHDDPSRARAGALLRYLERCGWLRSETQVDFSRALTLPEYAFRLLQVLAELSNVERRGLKGRVFAIFDLLRAAAQQGEAEYRVPEACKLTEELMVSLKELQHNIGQLIEDMLGQQQVSEVLAQFFGDYQRLLEERYRPLRTEDHVSRFRPGVLEALETIESKASGDGLLEQTARIREAFMAIDDILESLDGRIRQYTSAAVRKLELYLTQSTTTSGRLHRLLEGLTQREVGDVVQLQRLRLIKEESLYQPRRAALSFLPEVALPFIHPEERALTRARTLAALEITLRYSPAALRERLETWLGNASRRRASELPLETPEGLVTLIFVRHHHQQLNIELTELHEWIERGNYGFSDVWIARGQG